ncbi:MAG TPA: DinB family protein [Longimicrobiales bacterium]|nr:DinB family protein [Longimicrobiales bacterium]
MMDPGTPAEEEARRDPLPAEVADWIAESERQRDELRVLVDAHSTDALRWRPQPGGWSIAEHIRHLVLTNEEYIDALEESLGQTAAEGFAGHPPYASSFFGSRFLRSLEPPVERRFKTFKRLNPPSEPGSPDEVLAAFDAGMDRYEALLRSNARVDMGRARMRSPFLWLLKLTLAEAAQVVLAHNRRHLWLADEVIRSPGFPAAGSG